VRVPRYMPEAMACGLNARACKGCAHAKMLNLSRNCKTIAGHDKRICEGTEKLRGKNFYFGSCS